MTSSPLFVGIDVAKATLDIALRPHEQLWQIIYNDAHIEALVTQLTAIPGRHLSSLISITYIFGFRNDNAIFFNKLVQNHPVCASSKRLCR